MENEVQHLEALVARSKLVPTAGEFVPKSHFNNFGGNSTGANEYDHAGASSSVEGPPANHSREHEAQSYAGPSTSLQNVNFRSKNEYYSRNREPKYSKGKGATGGAQWKRTEKEFVKSNFGLKQMSSEKVGMLDPNRGHHMRENDVQYEDSPRGSSRNKRSHHMNNFRERGHANGKQSDRNGSSYFRSSNWSHHPRSYQDGPPPEDKLDYYQPHSTRREMSNWRQQDDRPFFADNDLNAARRSSVKNQRGKAKPSPAPVVPSTPNQNQNQNQNVEEPKEPRKSRFEFAGSNKTNQRERLIDLLTRGTLECLVCCELLHQPQPTWSCSNCYHVLHLKCVSKWARSSKSDDGWRCPACQHVTTQVPFDYLCFCGKTADPAWNRVDCPHSCGEMCGKSRPSAPSGICPHKCILLCHPGPCPPCTVTTTKYCGCGRTSKTLHCSSTDTLLCEQVCGKQLECSIHTCDRRCHAGPCDPCKIIISQECFCGKLKREVDCTVESVLVKTFCCGEACEKLLSCGNHTCNETCHDGECGPCSLSPSNLVYCPCGQNEIAALLAKDGLERKTCLDPVPTCGATCSKVLLCGQPGDRHQCSSNCHLGPCPPCPLETMVKCRCGHMDKVLPCSQLTVRADDARCDKRCSKKRSCGKHKCNQECCIEVDHQCTLPCNRLLGCGLHRCEAHCHRGHCQPCYRASFEELYCECGAQVMFPPVACGTKRPPCSEPCSREHPCEHPPAHNCHSDLQCPPCTVLTKKYCHGRHELRKAIPCYQDTFSCGLPCNKEMPCGRHKCILPCHELPCLKAGQICVQPCTTPRPLCGHPCRAQCHEGACPDSLCKEVVRVTCECGHRFSSRLCHDNATEYQRIATVQLASKIADMQAGQTFDLNDVTASKKLSYKTLECNDECKLIDRNRRLAIALQIRNPDLSAKLTPRYSELMRNWAKRDPHFCQMVHDKLTELVQLAKQSKQKSRSYSFDPMNRDKRHFVHEYCEHFGCESVAYDAEPKRNVVATALKEKSWLPSMSLLEVITRENGGARKVPKPINNTRLVTMAAPSGQRTMDVLPGKVLSPLQSSAPGDSPYSPSTSSSEPFIDPFDNP